MAATASQQPVAGPRRLASDGVSHHTVWTPPPTLSTPLGEQRACEGTAEPSELYPVHFCQNLLLLSLSPYAPFSSQGGP